MRVTLKITVGCFLKLNKTKTSCSREQLKQKNNWFKKQLV